MYGLVQPLSQSNFRIFSSSPSFPNLKGLFLVTHHSHPQPQASTNLLTVSLDLTFLDTSYNEIIQYTVFNIWLLSPRIMFPRCIQVVACVTSGSFLLLTNVHPIGWLCHILLTRWWAFLQSHWRGKTDTLVQLPW